MWNDFQGDVMTLIGLLLALLAATPNAGSAPHVAPWTQHDYSGAYYLTIGHSA